MQRSTFFAISKELETSPLSTQSIENHSQDPCLWYTVALQPGTLTSNQLSLTPPPTRNTWPSQMHQEKPSPEFNSFKNSAFHLHQFLFLWIATLPSTLQRARQ